MEPILTVPQFLVEVFASKKRMEKRLASHHLSVCVQIKNFVLRKTNVLSQVIVDTKCFDLDYQFCYFYKNIVLLILTVSLHLPSQFARKLPQEVLKSAKAPALATESACLYSIVLRGIVVK